MIRGSIDGDLSFIRTDPYKSSQSDVWADNFGFARHSIRTRKPEKCHDGTTFGAPDAEWVCGMEERRKLRIRWRVSDGSWTTMITNAWPVRTRASHHYKPTRG
jgi:hypothetical protein